MNGVKVSEQPHINLHEWLASRSTTKPLLPKSSTIQRASKGEHLLSFAQIILDGTFGICDKRLLLFIVTVMGIDEWQNALGKFARGKLFYCLVTITK